MSKTVEIQIEKSRGLVEGLRRHVKEMGERGVTNDEINAMEQAVKELEAVNEEVDRIREQLTPTVAKLKVAGHRRVRHFCVPDFFGLFAAADDFGDVHDHTAVAGHDLRHLTVPLLNHVLLHDHR